VGANNEGQGRGRGHPRGPARGGHGAARASPVRARGGHGAAKAAPRKSNMATSCIQRVN